MHCPNQRDDVETIQRLLNLCATDSRVKLDEGTLKPDGAFGKKTLNAIMAFQRNVTGAPNPSGQVEPNSETLFSLCESLPDTLDANLLAMIYLRAGDEDVKELVSRIVQIMNEREINTPLRRTHFLAQIGHESGELRFRAEIASGDAYEGRSNLGNTQPGDGRRFKGRGLIQLTGRANYSEYGRSIGREAEILAHPELIESDPVLCVDVAGWFWNRHKLNAFADIDDLKTITKRINGGLNGFEDRERLLKRAKSLIGV
jgi:predicted chitinase